MARPASNLAQKFIGAAKNNPRQAPQILRNAAQVFAGLASDPRNQHVKQRLTAIGFDFAGAAMKAQDEALQTATTGDFLQLLRDTAQAYDSLPAGSTHETEAMDILSMMPGITGGAAPGAAGGVPGAGGVPNSGQPSQRVSIAPASFDVNTTLGRTATITNAPTADQIAQGVMQSNTVAFWQGSKDESQAMSIDFGMTLPPLPSPGSVRGPNIVDSRPYAVVQYGADGNTQNSVTMDIGLGRRITVVGNYISVLVGMDPPRPYGGATSPTIVAGASIGTFAAPSIAPVTRTIYVDQLVAGDTTPIIPIPLRSVQMLPPLPASPTDTLTVSFLTYNANLIGLWEYTYSLTTFATVAPFTIPTDAYFITVTSAQGVPAGGRAVNGIRIPFELSL